jgi:hypothetical protein
MTMTSGQAEALFVHLLGNDWIEHLRRGHVDPDAADKDITSSPARALQAVRELRPDVNLSGADRRVLAEAWAALRHKHDEHI